MIAQVLGLGHHHSLCCRCRLGRGQSADRGLVQRRGLVHALKVEGVNALLLAVLEMLKSLCFRPCTTSPVFASRATTLVSTSSPFILQHKPPCGVFET
jgi:hypothetical protein